MARPSEATISGLSSEWGGIPAPGTGQLHYSLDGGSAFQVPLTDLGSNLYEATIPAVGCVNRVEYYVSIEEIGGATFTDPGLRHLWGSVASDTAAV
jgi:hypothetical protein